MTLKEPSMPSANHNFRPPAEPGENAGPTYQWIGQNRRSFDGQVC